MENIATAEPWKIAFFLIGCMVMLVVIAVWLFTGNKEAEPVSLDPVGSVKYLWSSLLHWRPTAMSSGNEETRWGGREPERSRSNEIPLLNHEEPEFPVREPNANAANLHLNADEVVALHRMIEHNKTAAKPSKTSTIQAGFGVSRGGGDKYQRASLIYDALFGPPQPAVKYRERTPEQERLREQLHLR